LRPPTLLRRAVTLAAGALCCLEQPSSVAAQDQAAWQAPPHVKLLQNPVKTDGAALERGQALFRRYCLPCHGPTGAADGKMARRLEYKPANLTLEDMNKLTDGEIFWKISKGRAPMPRWEEQFSERERWDLVSFVRTLVKLSQ